MINCLYMKLIKQGDENLFKNTRVLVIHLEFTSVCNQTCSYCLEDNGNPDKIEEKFSDPNKMLSNLFLYKPVVQDEVVKSTSR